MKRKIVIADTGVIISLSIINKLELLSQVFGEFYIAQSVWIELSKYKSILSNDVFLTLQDKVKSINGTNYLSVIMDYGESESVILCNEIKADFFVVDDKKARNIAESYGIKCLGTLGVMAIAKEENYISNLRPFFITLLENNRYYSIDLLNKILNKYGEAEIQQNIK